MAAERISERLESALVAAAGGDALGWITEMNQDPARLRSVVGSDWLADFGGHRMVCLRQALLAVEIWWEDGVVARSPRCYPAIGVNNWRRWDCSEPSGWTDWPIYNRQ